MNVYIHGNSSRPAVAVIHLYHKRIRAGVIRIRGIADLFRSTRPADRGSAVAGHRANAPGERIRIRIRGVQGQGKGGWGAILAHCDSSRIAFGDDRRSIASRTGDAGLPIRHRRGRGGGQIRGQIDRPEGTASFQITGPMFNERAHGFFIYGGIRAKRMRAGIRPEPGGAVRNRRSIATNGGLYGAIAFIAQLIHTQTR